jgi:aminoglycoside phosphotransferase (APT) family kinase protein
VSNPEVVVTDTEAGNLSRAPLVVLSALQRYLDDQGLGAGPVTAQRIGAGSSNATFLLARGPDRFVLRRPPRPPYPPSAHDIVREARLQMAVARQGIPVPNVVALEETSAVLGVPFAITDYVDADVVTGELPRLLKSDEGQRRQLIESFVRTLCRIHQADIGAPELEPFSRPGDFLERQLRRFDSLWEHNATRNVPAVADVGRWLAANRPPSGRPSVVHGDYRLGNVMVSRRAPAEVVAVLDWEMGAIGDPRTDLGYLLATYSEGPATAANVLELSPVTRLRGFPTRGEIVEYYEATVGESVGDLTWFETLALWKGAIFCEAIHARHVRGELEHDSFAARLEEGVPLLAQAAQDRATRSSAG